MSVQVFYVEHGACAWVTSSSGGRMLIDCGHNATTGWRPSIYLPQSRITDIDVLAITNYDEDHVSDLSAARKAVSIHSVLRNTSVDAADLNYMKHEHGVGLGIAEGRSMNGVYNGQQWQRDWGDISKYEFWNSNI